MSLIVEDGSIVSGAESYVTVAFCDDYFSKRSPANNTTWSALTTASKEAALRDATDYMLQAYRYHWLGRRVNTLQFLDWPRVGVVIEDFVGGQSRNGLGSYGIFQVPFNIVPLEVQKACAELALRASIALLNPDLTQNITEKTVGPIQVKYDVNSPQFKRYREIDMTLRVYLSRNSSSPSVGLTRA